MNQLTRLTSLDIPQLHRYSVGFDRVFDQLRRATEVQSTSGNYPPYNIIQHDENSYSVEIAVAGFKPTDLDVSLDNNVLTITGKHAVAEDGFEPPTYLHQGISAREFTRTFNLADHVEVMGAKVENGLMVISLNKIVPESLKPRKIDITIS